MSRIIRISVQTEFNDHDNDGYDKFLNDIHTSFAYATRNNEPLFTTDVKDLYKTFLMSLPEKDRQYYNCHTCEDFINKYGGLVTIDDNGELIPAMWNFIAPDLFREAVNNMFSLVKKAKVTGVLYMPCVGTKCLGISKTGVWTHMSVDVPKHIRTYNHQDIITGRRPDFEMLADTCSKYAPGNIATAVNLLRHGSLYRSEKFVKNAEWLLDIKKHSGSRNFSNVVWKRVATAPSGFCHISSSMLGTLLDDIQVGYDFDTIKSRWNEKMNPTQYQRPQAAPTAQNVARAEKIVADLGISNSLKRRYARLDEIKKVWVPKEERITNTQTSGVFSGIKTKESNDTYKSIIGGPVTMTWEKFKMTILPYARKIEVKLNYGKDGYAALVTAVDPTAPPIIKWDTVSNRNPFNWYMYSGGSYAIKWNLKSGYYVEVTGITLQPNLWQPGYEHLGKGVFFILKGCKDIENKASALFPEILRNELREVRSTIEAYSNQTPLSGESEADACGICYQAQSSNWNCNLRVTTDVGVSMYNIDRWD